MDDRLSIHIDKEGKTRKGKRNNFFPALTARAACSIIYLYHRTYVSRSDPIPRKSATSLFAKNLVRKRTLTHS